MAIAICPKCHKGREVVRVRAENLCAKCAGLERTTEPNLCITCGSKRSKTSERGKECLECYKKSRKNDTKYFRVCIDCGDSKEVTREYSTKTLRCPSCAAKEKFRLNPMPKRVPSAKTIAKKEAAKLRAKEIASKPKKRVMPKKTPRTGSKASIARAQKINKEHREIVESEKKDIPEQKLSDEDMMKAFLKKNKPSVIDTFSGDIPHMAGQKHFNNV